jgi:hypothetical protein
VTFTHIRSQAASVTMEPVDRCTFCPRPAPGTWALTACSGDPEDSASWRREILPVCPRCNALIRQDADKGRVLKATGERWYGGHRIGRFDARGIGAWDFPSAVVAEPT